MVNEDFVCKCGCLGKICHFKHVVSHNLHILLCTPLFGMNLCNCAHILFYNCILLSFGMTGTGNKCLSIKGWELGMWNKLLIEKVVCKRKCLIRISNKYRTQFLSINAINLFLYLLYADEESVVDGNTWESPGGTVCIDHNWCDYEIIETMESWLCSTKRE